MVSFLLRFLENMKHKRKLHPVRDYYVLSISWYRPWDGKDIGTMSWSGRLFGSFSISRSRSWSWSGPWSWTKSYSGPVRVWTNEIQKNEIQKKITSY